MASMNRRTIAPVGARRSNRIHNHRNLTAFYGGKFVPVAFVPLLREDMCRGRIQLSLEMKETSEVLMNPVSIRAKAYLVPNLAFPRFGNIDNLNRSYAGEPAFGSEDVIPYIVTERYAELDGEDDVLREIYVTAGLHEQPDAMVNTAYVESYNLVWNHEAALRSKDITKRALDDYSLAPAFWVHQNFTNIVPDYDLAVLAGEVALNVVNTELALSDNAPVEYTNPGGSMNGKLRFAGGSIVNVAQGVTSDIGGNTQLSGGSAVAYDPNGTLRANLSAITAELAADGITVSLANLASAKRAAAWARIRERYTELTDAHLIGILMQGIQVPEESLKYPILLDQSMAVFGQSKRYATDAANLDVHMANGATFLNLDLSCPRINTGGMIVVTVEVTPEQLFERQADPYFTAQSVDDLPNYQVDDLDPYKVATVKNKRIDIDHTTPDGTFGFEPLHAKWNIDIPRIGGPFFRPLVDGGFDEDRARIWAAEMVDPVLSENLYLANDLHHEVFVDPLREPFECVTIGQCVINGLTVLGPVLVEASNNYDETVALIPPAPTKE